MAQSTNKNIVIGISWYSPEQWRLLKSISFDADRLDDTYDEWVKNVERTISMLNEQGLAIKKVPIDVSELVQWCTEQGVVLDGEARSGFVAKKLEEQDQT